MEKLSGIIKAFIDLIKAVREAWPLLGAALVWAAPFWASLPGWAVWALVAAGAALLITGVYRMRRPLLYLPLRAAAVLAYEKLDGGLYQIAADRMHDEPSPASSLEYMAQLLVNRGDMRLFGLRPPSRKFKAIEPVLLRRGAIEGNCSVFRPHDPKELPWVDLYVRRTELRARIKTMRAEDWRKR